MCLAHRITLIGAPDHSGLVVARPDGSLGMLEAGPYDTLRGVCFGPDAPAMRLPGAGDQVWIRRRRVPLTPEQSAQLTAFALAQEGKPFALVRVLLQGTPLRGGPLRTWWLGKPQQDRAGWFCSELVTEACVVAGLLDCETARPSATFPRISSLLGPGTCISIDTSIFPVAGIRRHAGFLAGLLAPVSRAFPDGQPATRGGTKEAILAA